MYWEIETFCVSAPVSSFKKQEQGKSKRQTIVSQKPKFSRKWNENCLDFFLIAEIENVNIFSFSWNENQDQDKSR